CSSHCSHIVFYLFDGIIVVYLLNDINLSRFTIIFFFNDTSTSQLYTLSLHDALPISWLTDARHHPPIVWNSRAPELEMMRRRSTPLRLFQKEYLYRRVRQVRAGLRKLINIVQRQPQSRVSVVASAKCPPESLALP